MRKMRVPGIRKRDDVMHCRGSPAVEGFYYPRFTVARMSSSTLRPDSRFQGQLFFSM
jgi:hypothetical protein